MPKVSVILACHNVEDFIDDALATIVAQSEFENFEVIPVDDGSTDGTWEIIERYAREHPGRFHPIRFDAGSGGPGRPRNAGLDIATGEYVIFMDPDDRIYEDGYSTLLHAIEEHGSDIVIGTRYGVPEKKSAEERVWVDWIANPPYVNDGSSAVKRSLLRHRPVILKSIYRRDRIEEWGLRFLEGVSSSEDEIFDKKYLFLSDRITKINDVVYLYTVTRTGSITSKIKLKVFEDLAVIIPGIEDALSVYFDDVVVSSRIAGLLPTFYLPKLLLLEDAPYSRGLDEIRAACAAFGWSRLLQATNPADRRIVALLRDRKDRKLIAIFKRIAYLRGHRVARIAYNLATKPLWVAARYRRRLASIGRTAKRLAPLAATGEGPAKIWASLVRKDLAGEPNGYWLFMDRRDKGADNGEALYRYVRDNAIHDKIAFIIARDCEDWARLAADGFNLVEYNTLAQWRLLYNCEHFFASHVDNVIIQPWCQFGAPRGEPRYKLDFLQHGIIRSDLSAWLGAKEYNTFVASSTREYQGLLANPRYRLTPDVLKLTGLARHDLLGGTPENYIVVCPTWRSFLLGASTDAFAASEFFQNWDGFLSDERLLSELRTSGLKVKLVLHSSLAEHHAHFRGSDVVEVVDFNDVRSFAELLSGARMMVTDYSTISFDMIYQRRPVVFFTFPERRKHSTNVGADLDIYATLGTRTNSVSAAVDAVIATVRSDFALPADKIAAADSFFAFGVDGNNRKRIIDAVTAKDA